MFLAKLATVPSVFSHFLQSAQMFSNFPKIYGYGPFDNCPMLQQRTDVMVVEADFRCLVGTNFVLQHQIHGWLLM